MTNGKTTVDHFVGSKADVDQSLEMNHNANNTQSNHHQSHSHVNHHNTSSHHSHHHHNQSLPASAISSIFYEASMQKTGNFRSGIAYNPAPVKFERPAKVSTTPLKVKSNMSTFRLIAISEESRLSNYPKRVSFRKHHHTTSNTNPTLVAHSHSESPTKKIATPHKK